MSNHAIVLPSGRRVSVGAYVKAWRTLLSVPPDYPVAAGWDHFAVHASDALRDIRHGCEDRINRHLPAATGRKYTPQWQQSARRVADYLQGRYVIRNRDVPKELRARLAHRMEDV